MLKYRLNLLGAMQLFDADGIEITPSSAKAQGLLAILAIENGRPVPRAKLQDLLWSDRGPTHGRNSLKKSLSLIKSTFGETGNNILVTNGGPVSLDMDRLTVDIYSDRQEQRSALQMQEFLLGIDIRDPKFNAWLADIRQTVEQRPDPTPAMLYGPVQRQRYHIALMPPQIGRNDDYAQLFGGLVYDRVAVALQNSGLYKVLDFRTTPETEGRGADVVVDLRLLTIGDETALHFIARKLPDNEVIWGRRQSFQRSGFGTFKIAALVSDVVDEMTEAIRTRTSSNDTDQSRAAREAMDGIDRIFRLTSDNLEKASTSLRTAIELSPERSTYRAWYAFLTAYRLEDSKGQNVVELREHAREIAEHALALDPHNPLTRALLTHVYAFVINDFNAAHGLINPMERQPPDLPLYHMARTFLNFYIGNIDKAQKSAAELGRFSDRAIPSAMFLTARLNVALAKGDLKSAISLGERAIQSPLQPNHKYEPALRYLAIAHARSHDMARARQVVERLKRQAPRAYSAELISQPYMTPTHPVRQIFDDLSQINRLFV
ncbi:MAG: hypothetical protein AAFQ22_15125 [Pseudomonadota bacterium]